MIALPCNCNQLHLPGPGRLLAIRAPAAIDCTIFNAEGRPIAGFNGKRGRAFDLAFENGLFIEATGPSFIEYE